MESGFAWPKSNAVPSIEPSDFQEFTMPAVPIDLCPAPSLYRFHSALAQIVATFGQLNPGRERDVYMRRKAKAR